MTHQHRPVLRRDNTRHPTHNNRPHLSTHKPRLDHVHIMRYRTAPTGSQREVSVSYVERAAAMSSRLNGTVW
jgi:hypothetical protein